MSRMGKLAVEAPKGVEVKLAPNLITVKGPKGELKMPLTDDVTVNFEDNSLTVSPRDAADSQSRSMWGTTRANIQNMVTGVSDGFERNLELVGVGYRAALKGNDLELSLGYSHPIVYKAPEGITFKCAKPTEVNISGPDKQTVGQVAAEIRNFRPPEPYKGKGVRRAGEHVRRKEGKKK